MNKNRKTITCGKYEFNVEIDRDIAISSMEQFPELTKYVFNMARQPLQDGKTLKDINEIDIFLDALDKKELSKFMALEDQIAELVKVAFPLMLKKAGSDLDAKEIIDYIYANGVDEEFNAGIYEMVLLGFTPREVPKKKVNFSMK